MTTDPSTGKPQRPIWARGEGGKDPQRWPESNHHYQLFERFLLVKPKPGKLRKLASFARLVKISPGSIHQYSYRFNWQARAKAYDEQGGRLPPPQLQDIETVKLGEPVTPASIARLSSEADRARQRHESNLEDHRKRCEELGRLQLSVARNMTVLCANALMEHQRAKEAMDEGLPAKRPYMGFKDIQGMASCASGLASSGRELEGQSLAVDQIMEVATAIRARLPQIQPAAVSPLSMVDT